VISTLKISWSLWAVWYAYWIISARRRIRSAGEVQVKRESAAGRAGYLLLMIVGLVLLFWRMRLPYLGTRLWPSSGIWASVGLTVEVMGMALAFWARYTLRANWTGRITTAGSQQLVVTGPYKLVRHPIYTGGLLAILGSAIVAGVSSALLGFGLTLIGIWIKLQREEAALREHFGSAYEEYSQRVSAVVPLP
jgi:protein-S-isoprenylcysteine O-methyltransferase Ste14